MSHHFDLLFACLPVTWILTWYSMLSWRVRASQKNPRRCLWNRSSTTSKKSSKIFKKIFKIQKNLQISGVFELPDHQEEKSDTPNFLVSAEPMYRALIKQKIELVATLEVPLKKIFKGVRTPPPEELADRVNGIWHATTRYRREKQGIRAVTLGNVFVNSQNG